MMVRHAAVRTCVKVLGLAVGLAVLAPAAAETGADAWAPRPAAQALRAIDAAELRVKRIGDLQAQSRNAGYAIADFNRQREALPSGRADALSALDEARAAQAPVADCLEALRALRDAQVGAVPGWRDAAALARQQVKALATASATTLAAAVAESDRGAVARAVAEQSLAEGQVRLRKQPLDCRGAAVRADQKARFAAIHQHRWELAARELAQRAQGLRERVDAALAAARDASGALRLNWRMGAATWPDAGALAALPAALDAAEGPLDEADVPAIDVADAMRTTALRDALQQRIDELARLEDAAAYLDLLVDEARLSCRGDGCAPLETDRAQLQERLESAGAALQTALQALATLPLSARAPLAAPLEQLQARQRRLQGLEAATTAAAEPAALQSAQAQAALEALDSVLQHAQAQALRDRDEAYLVAYGRHAPVLPRATEGETVYSSMSGSALAMAAPPRLGGHAYELVNRWDTEPRSFGAYTYVLLRSATDLQRPEVQRRWLQLLERVMIERRAGDVAESVKINVNLICIPANEEHPTAAAGLNPKLQLYASDLGLQWLLRANAGLLTRPELRKKLVTSPGPFLITLPSRLADARTATPLLFADLSGYSDDAVADLVSGYMGSLLVDFPSQQAQWKPPVPQRVALQMIRLAADASELVMSVIPGVVAAPQR